MRRLRLIAIAFAALLVLAIGGGYAYLALKDRNAPPPLTLGKPAPGPPIALPNTRWVVLRSKSIVGFRAREKYLSLPVPSEVVGRTSVVRGTMETRDGAIVATSVIVDMRPYGTFTLGSQPASGRRLEVAGRLRTTMTSFGFDPPSVAGLTTVQNGVAIEVKLTFVRSG